MTDADADSAIALALEFEPKAGLDDMIQIVMDRRWTLYCGQRARLIADMTDRPMTEAVKEIAALIALEDFLLSVKQRPAEVGRRLQKRAANAEA
ncbi:hypothetical protein [Bradyrhizobium sp. USDA 4350]